MFMMEEFKMTIIQRVDLRINKNKKHCNKNVSRYKELEALRQLGTYNILLSNTK